MVMSRNIRIALVIAFIASGLLLAINAEDWELDPGEIFIAALPLALVLGYWFIMGEKKKDSGE
jgi:hypothetical protein